MLTPDPLAPMHTPDPLVPMLTPDPIVPMLTPGPLAPMLTPDPLLTIVPMLKGTVSRDFLYPVFFINQFILVPLEMSMGPLIFF